MARYLPNVELRPGQNQGHWQSARQEKQMKITGIHDAAVRVSRYPRSAGREELRSHVFRGNWRGGPILLNFYFAPIFT